MHGIPQLQHSYFCNYNLPRGIYRISMRNDACVFQVIMILPVIPYLTEENNYVPHIFEYQLRQVNSNATEVTTHTGQNSHLFLQFYSCRDKV